MANITAQAIDEDGLNNPTTQAAAGGGDAIVSPGDGVVFMFVNGDAAPHDFKVDDPRTRTPSGATTFDPDVTINVAAGQRAFVWLPGDRFTNPTTGVISVSYPGSDVTSCTVAAFRIVE